MTDKHGFSYFYQKVCAGGYDCYLDVVRPLVISREEFYVLPPHAPDLEYSVGIYGVEPMGEDCELQLLRKLDDRHSSFVRKATPREVLDYIWANPDLPSPYGSDGDPGQPQIKLSNFKIMFIIFATAALILSLVFVTRRQIRKHHIKSV